MIFEYAKRFYKKNEYPALAARACEWAIDKPLKGLKILDATPVFRNTVLKYDALIAAGAELTVGISDVMPYDSGILQMLDKSGISVVNASDTPQQFDVILDCAGAFSAWPARYGVSELTRSGAYVYENCGLPVFLADEGHIKRIETCLGTGDGFFRAMEQLGYSDWKDKRIVVFGSGKVGTGIIYMAVKMGLTVDVVTAPETLSPYIAKIINRCVDFSNSAEIEEIIKDAYAVVTATGVKGAVASCVNAQRVIESGALLVNMGVEDEYGDAFPAESVLNHKSPLNFILEEPTQMRYIDATMALHNEGALYLVKEQPVSGIVTPPAVIEDTIIDVTRRNGLIADELDLIYNLT